MLPTTLLALFVAASSNQYTPTFPGGIIAWIVCNARKRQEFGGWLLFYYWQLYSGVFLSVILFTIAFQSYVPENFDNHTRYRWFLISAVPSLILFALQVAVATFLISVRTWDLLRLLRRLIVAALAAASIATAIDIKYFPDNVAFNFLTIVPGILWLAYFFKSRRVRHVFKSHDWEVAVNAIHPTKPPTLAT